MAFVYINGSRTFDTTEWSLASNVAMSTPPTPQSTEGTVTIHLDTNALVAGDEYLLLGYEKVRSTSTQRVAFRATIGPAPQMPNYESPARLLSRGWDWSLKKVAGANATIEWEIRRIPG